MKTLFVTITILFTLFMIPGCSQQQPQIIYKEHIQYVYLPCEKSRYSDDITKTYSPNNGNKTEKSTNIKSKKNGVNQSNGTPKKIKAQKAKYFEPQPTKIFAPEKFITRPNQPMNFMIGYNEDGSEFVYMEGEFGRDTYKNFVDFIDKSNTSAREIKINSNGGLLSTAMEIGSYIREHRWDTGVDTEMKCYSACTFVYFAGHEKSIQGKGQLGLHRPYYPNKKDTQRDIMKIKREYISYWNYIHAPKDLYDDMMDVNRDELLILDRHNIDEYLDVTIK